MTLKKDFERVCAAYISEFELKQNVTFKCFVDDMQGGLCEFKEGYFINLYEIIIDLEQRVPRGLILHWHDAITESENMVNDNYKTFLLEFNN
jgi:hypothetical protein